MALKITKKCSNCGVDMVNCHPNRLFAQKFYQRVVKKFAPKAVEKNLDTTQLGDTMNGK